MRLASIPSAILAVLLGGAASVQAATDFSARNERFQPGGAVTITKTKSGAVSPAQALHAVPPRLTPAVTAASEGPAFRRGPIIPASAPVRWDVIRATAEPAPMNRWNGRLSELPAVSRVTLPQTAVRYQASLAAASHVSAPQQPKIERTPVVPLNRFAAERAHAAADSQAVTKPKPTPPAAAQP